MTVRMITYPRHAKERIAERKIRPDDVETAIKEPFELIGARYGRFAACLKLQRSGFLIVVYEREDEDFLVVTAVKVNREGAKRFGFTRV